MTSFQVENIQIVNEGKAGNHIETGVGFFDHMLDQLNSHAQVGVGLRVLQDGEESMDMSSKNRLSSQNQILLCNAVAEKLGSAMVASLQTDAKPADVVSRFCCPLDEALVECEIRPANKGANDDSNFQCELAPYGIYPKGMGRTRIGQWETMSVESFWKTLSKSSGLSIRLKKVRGDNGHHIVESAFKAFSRALRNYLDLPSNLWTVGGVNDQAGIALNRAGTVARSTKETSISVDLKLNGKLQDTKIETGIATLDEFFTVFAQSANLSLQVSCQGDLWVDDHHTAEDVSIAIGQCITQALGTKAGLNRMWVATSMHGDAKVEVTMDLSNRPYLGHNLHDALGLQEYVNPNTTVPLSCEMMEHALDSLVANARMTVHIVNLSVGSPVSDVVMATAKAFGEAFRVCAMVDRRRAGQTASSKGTLSV
eukprot:Nitzschia sp. Nitz4//scaffold274_size25273//18638//19912//NITZ4_008330-RA/size25273-processed-gene-0.14-mRNA-1//-1//CDS//3329545290//9064//frame0